MHPRNGERWLPILDILNNSRNCTVFLHVVQYIPCAGDTVLGIVADCRPDVSVLHLLYSI